MFLQWVVQNLVTPPLAPSLSMLWAGDFPNLEVMLPGPLGEKPLEFDTRCFAVLPPLLCLSMLLGWSLLDL